MGEELSGLPEDVVSRMNEYASKSGIEKPTELLGDDVAGGEVDLGMKVEELKQLPNYDPLTIIKLLIS